MEKRILANMLDVSLHPSLRAHTYALLADGSMWTWGWNDHGQCGNGEKSERVEPTQLDELSRLSHQWQTTIVRAGGGHSGTLFLSPLT
mmetsp:Transcript_20195/g.51575  ORF Transcript_20195/g.51575 Transcript_20195/m.51575 type:complete len:88 (-) Transcript_20195:258-521(-)